jgi:endonuclease/exonuclease/phosphatase (EEP) superfamily protein YafD
MARKKIASLVGLFEAAAVVLALFSVSTLFDVLHRYLELFSHFRLQYFVSSILLLLFFSLFRKRNFAALALLLSVLNGWAILPWYLSGDTRGYGDDTIKVLHANLLASNHDANRFLALVVEEDPDIVVVQEMTPRWLASLEPLTSNFAYSAAEPEVSPFGIGLFSKTPIDNVQIVNMPPVGAAEIRASVLFGQQSINIVTSHTMPPLGEESFNARNEHIAATVAALPVDGSPTILIGDLNISMWAAHYRRFEDATGLRNTRRGFGILPTWPLFLPFAMIPIDHCLVSEEFVVVDMRTGPNIGSDHYPIIVTLALVADE